MSGNRTYINQKASDDFNKAKSKATISGILNALTPERQRLLSLEDVKKLVKPKSETYLGMKAVPVKLIVGSEGRYKDFTKAFLPKKEFSRSRWENVDKAHLQSIILPPIKLYEIGGTYFVRDGNHRVSVAKAQGVMDIDAEVIRLDTEIKLEPDISVSDLKKKVIQYEKERVFRETGLDKVINPDSINFTATGRFIEMLRHIQGHKYFLNEDKDEEIPFLEAAASWYENLYKPIADIVREEKILSRFPGRTEGDMYLWIVKHWDELKKHYGNNFSLRSAAIDFSKQYGSSHTERIKKSVKKLFGRD